MCKRVGKTRVRTVGLWLLLALLLSACQPIQRLPETKTVAAASAETPLEVANQAVIQRFYDEVINQKKFDLFAEIFDPQSVAHDLGMKPDIDMLFTAFPDLHVTADQWILKGDMVTSIATFAGTHEAEFMGVAATHKPLTWTQIDIHRMKDGKIVEVWHNIPFADILHQIQGDATGETAAEAANQAVVQRFYEEVVNQKKVEVFQEVFDPNMVEHSLGIGVTITDTELLAALPDLHLTVDLWMVEGDLVTAVVTTSGTHQAEFMGVAPTGNKVSWSSIDIWRVKDGKITDVWHDVPNEDILQQIGYTLVPPVKIMSDTATLTQEIPFTGTVEAQETYIITAPTMLVDTTGSGEATELGQFTVTWEFTVNLDTGAGVGSAHFIAANGDSLDTTSLGQGTPSETPDVNQVVEQHTITGGTGIFAGATGSFTLERLVSTVTGVTSGSFEGSIVLQKAK